MLHGEARVRTQVVIARLIEHNPGEYEDWTFQDLAEALAAAPGAAALADHPKTVNLREDVVVPALNAWIGRLFDPNNLDATVAELVGSQAGGERGEVGREAAKARLADAETRRRHQAAISAGVDPAALVEVINQTQAECETARAELAHAPAVAVLDPAEVYAMIDSLGEVGAALVTAKPQSLAQLYAGLGLELRYEHEERAVHVTARPRVVSRVSEGRVAH